MTNEIILNSVLNILLGFVVAGVAGLFIWAVADYRDSQKLRKIDREAEKFYTSCPKCFWSAVDTNQVNLLAQFRAHDSEKHARPNPDTCEHKTIFTEWAEGPYDLQLKYELAVCSTCHTIVNKKELKK